MKFKLALLATLISASVFAAQKADGDVPAQNEIQQGKVKKNSKNKAEKLAEIASKRIEKNAAQDLPGVGRIPGDDDVWKPKTVRVTPDRTQVINVSDSLPNRIATPFANPQAIDDQKKDFDVQAIGQSLYVKMKTGNTVALYVTGDKPNDPVLSLTLVPKKLPAQTITVQLDKALGAGRASEPVSNAGEEAAPESNLHEDRIRYVMRVVGQGKSPEGYTENALPKATAKIKNDGKYALVLIPQKRYSGSTDDLYLYKVTAIHDIELQESAFFEDGVRAVAIYPNSTLKAGESTQIIIQADKVGE